MTLYPSLRSLLRIEAVDTPISFSPILGPLKCLLPLVLPLLVASWRTTLLDFPYLALPAFQWRSTSHSISEKENLKLQGKHLVQDLFYSIIRHQ